MSQRLQGDPAVSFPILSLPSSSQPSLLQGLAFYLEKWLFLLFLTFMKVPLSFISFSFLMVHMMLMNHHQHNHHPLCLQQKMRSLVPENLYLPETFSSESDSSASVVSVRAVVSNPPSMHIAAGHPAQMSEHSL